METTMSSGYSPKAKYQDPIQKLIADAVKHYENKPDSDTKLKFWKALAAANTVNEKTLSDTMKKYPDVEKGLFTHYTSDQIKKIRDALQTQKKQVSSSQSSLFSSRSSTTQKVDSEQVVPKSQKGKP